MRKGRVEGPGTVRGWPLLGVMTWVPGDRIPSSPPQLGSQGRGPGGCLGTNRVGAMNIQAAHLHANYTGTDSEQPMAVIPNDQPETLPWTV